MPKFESVMSQTLLYGFSIAIMKGISILMLPFIATQLSQEAFGRLEVLASFAVIGSILVGLGLEDTLYRFAGQAGSPDARKQVAARVFGFALTAGAILLILAWFSAASLVKWLPGGITTYEIRLILLVLALEGAIAVPMGWLRMQDRALVFFTSSISRAAIQAGLILVMLQPGDDITAVLEAGLIAATLQATALFCLQVRDTGISLRLGKSGSLIHYSLPIVGSGLIAFALNGLDRWIIADQVGLVAVAEYGVASKFALAAVLLLQPFSMWWSPKRFQVIAGADGKRAAVRIIGVGISLCLIICVGVASAAPIIISLLMPADYVLAATYTVGLVLAMTLREICELVNIGCYLNRSTMTQLWINLLGSMIGLAVMLALVGQQGVWGVIAALITSQAVRLVLFFRASQSFERLEYPLGRLALLGAQALCWIGISTQMNGLQQQIGFVVLASAAMVISAIGLKLLPGFPRRGEAAVSARVLEW